MKPSGPFFTEKARAAADVARRRRAVEAEASKQQDCLSVFAARSFDDGKFTWEIRQFGGIIITRGVETFSSAALARQAGKVALIERRPTTPAL